MFSARAATANLLRQSQRTFCHVGTLWHCATASPSFRLSPSSSQSATSSKSGSPATSVIFQCTSEQHRNLMMKISRPHFSPNASRLFAHHKQPPQQQQPPNSSSSTSTTRRTPQENVMEQILWVQEEQQHLNEMEDLEMLMTVEAREQILNRERNRILAVIFGCGLLLGLVLGYLFAKLLDRDEMRQLEQRLEEAELNPRSQVIGSMRETFLRWADVIKEGEHYMTPRRFIQSLIFVDPSAAAATTTMTTCPPLPPPPPPPPSSSTTPAPPTPTTSTESTPTTTTTTTNKSGSSPQACESLLFQIADHDHDGLISFADYSFVHLLLSSDAHQYRIAFKMFDKNGDEAIGLDDFLSIIDSRAAATLTEADSEDFERVHLRELDIQNTVVSKLFGEKGDKKLSYEQFVDFLHGLKVDLLHHEFSIFDPDNSESIPMEAFINLVSSKLFNPNSANMPHLKNQLIRLRDRGFFKSSNDRVPFDTFLAFAELSRHADDITQAIQMYTAGGRPLQRNDFIRAVQDVADVSIHPKEVDIVFALFDTKEDGVLDYDEFLKAISSYSDRAGGSARRYADIPHVK